MGMCQGELSGEIGSCILALKRIVTQGNFSDLIAFKNEKNLKARFENGLCILINEHGDFTVEKLTCDEIKVSSLYCYDEGRIAITDHCVGGSYENIEKVYAFFRNGGEE